MGVNKVVYGENVLIDLTEDTVDATKILSGYTAHDRTGAAIIGVASGETLMVTDAEELESNYDSEDGFFISYNNVNNGQTFITNTVDTSKGIFTETTSSASASAWFLEAVPNYTNRYYIYTIIEGSIMYMYNVATDTNKNFMGLSSTDKTAFDFVYEIDTKFYIKVANANKWLQHSNGGGGIRLYTDKNNANNTQMSFTYLVNAIVPYGTLEINENGTYDVTTYSQIIVNISNE